MLLSGEYPPLSRAVNPICLDLCEITEPLEGFQTLKYIFFFIYSCMLPHYAKESKQFNLLSISYAQYTGMKTDFGNFVANLLKKKICNIAFA